MDTRRAGTYRAAMQDGKAIPSARVTIVNFRLPSPRKVEGREIVASRALQLFQASFKEQPRNAARRSASCAAVRRTH